jgi:hypothetical protein
MTTEVKAAPETKTVVSVSLSATFDSLPEALEFVESVKDRGITNFNLSQYETYSDGIPF